MVASNNGALGTNLFSGKSLLDTIKKYLSGNASKNMYPADFLLLFSNQQTVELRNLLDVMRGWSNKQFNTTVRKMLAQTRYQEVYVQYTAALSGKSAMLERNELLGSLRHVLEQLLIYTQQLETHLTNLPEDDTLRQAVAGDQMATSYMVTSGFLFVTEYLCSFTKNFIVAITQQVVKSTVLNATNNPSTYVAKHIETAATITNAYTHSLEKHKSIVQLIEQLKKDSTDMTISDGQKSPNAMLASITDSLPLARTYGMFCGFSLNPYRWIADKIMLWQHSKYLKKKEEKNWIENHIRLLYLHLEGKDPNSEEYLKLKKTLAIYEDMIKKLNRQIDEYTNS